MLAVINNDMKNNKDVQTIEFNYDNLGVLKCVKYLLGVVVNDIEYMNSEAYEIAGDYMIDYDLGSNYHIEVDDLESIVSIIDTLENVIEYNEGCETTETIENKESGANNE